MIEFDLQIYFFQMSSDQSPGYLLYIWDYTTQLYGGYRGYNKPL